ncbi:MAG: glycosyltransferase [Nitrospirae bacterium]|nr:glycosyltransferase [Nitrospirota bacterium]
MSELQVKWVPLPRLSLFKNFFIRLYAYFVPNYVSRCNAVFVQAENSTAMELCTHIKVPIIFDIHGDVVAEQNPSKENYQELATTDEAFREKVLLSKAQLLIVNSQNLIEVLHNRHEYILSNIIVLPCATRIDRFTRHLQDRESIRKRLGLNDKLVLCYLGGLSSWQCVGQTIKLVAELKKRKSNIHFLLITPDDTSAYDSELLKIGNPDLDYTILSLSAEDVPRMLSAADAGLLLRALSPINYVASPTKCGEYLSSGVPVITTKHAGDATWIIKKELAGYILENEEFETKDLVKIELFLADVEKNRNEWSAKTTRVASSYYNWSVYESAYFQACAYLENIKLS